MIKYKSPAGKTGFSNAVFARIAVQCATEYKNKFILSTSKGRPVKAGETGHEKLNFIEISETKDADAVNMKIYIIIRFGSSISGTTRAYAQKIRTECEKITGFPVNELKITVTGIKSKKIARRELEIVC